MTTRPTDPAAPNRSRWAWAWSPRGTLALLVLWAGFHALLRLALSSALTADDAREAVLAQSLQWGYQARQPPLYNWLAWLAFRLAGPGLLALTLLKYGILVLAFWLVYLIARRILADPRLATIGAFSFLLIVPISWTIHESLTHSVAVLAACAGTAYALIRLEQAPSMGRYAALGLALGLGLLSKFTYVVSLAGLGLAGLTVDRYRARLAHPRILVAGTVAAALVLPFALWFVGERHDLARLYASEVRIGNGDDWLVTAGAGLAYVARIAAYYLAPLGAVLAACVPVVYRRVPPATAGPPGGRLLGWLLVWVLGLLGAAALAGSLGFLKFRWLIPAFCLAPLYALWRLERHGGPSGRQVRALTAVLMIAEIAVVVGLAIRVTGASHFPRPYRMNEPYDEVASGLVRAGFTRGTILAGFGTIAGNLVVRFPDSRVLHTEYADFEPPRSGDGQCLLVWDRQRGDRDPVAMPAALRALADGLGVPLTGSEPIGVVEAPFRFDRHHVRRTYYVLLPAGAGRCR